VIFIVHMHVFTLLITDRMCEAHTLVYVTRGDGVNSSVPIFNPSMQGSGLGLQKLKVLCYFTIFMKFSEFIMLD